MRAIVDVRAASAAAERAEALGIEVRRGAEVIGVGGKRHVAYVDIRQRSSGGTARIAADALLISGGFTPNVQLASMTRAKLAWSSDIAAYVPGTPVQRERSAGAARGCFGIAAAAADGEAAGHAAAEAAGFARSGDGGPRLEMPAAAVSPIEAFWEVPQHGKAFVDIQHDVKADDIRLANQEGYSHIEHAKRYTTHAMATDQGKTGGLVGAAVLAAARGIAVEAVGLPTMRPYTSPVTWGAFAGREVGKHFHAVRRTPLDDWNRRNGAVFMDAGLWARAAYYPRSGEGVWDAILREARTVRTAVGICDVSTLGKIDLQGKDAATFLDRLYTNTFSTLPVGRARYGLMLREDGIVFDDGTTSRLAADRFLVTTTTAKAAEVLEHMEHYAQVVWPELDVQMCSVTDQWGQMSIAGPKAREVLAAAVDGLKLGNDQLPFMGVGAGRVAGVPVTVYRISFSGELAYEISAPAGDTEAVWSAILEAGEPHGIAPYGVEALSVLRVEKGHVAGPELNGQTTAGDLGLGRMLKKSGDFVGRVNAARPGLVAPNRPRLVGIQAVTWEFGKRLRAGAHIVASEDSKASLGWVTSVTRSVELDRWIGLAMVRGGPERIGATMYATYPLKGEVMPVTITSPHHVDPENQRVRA
jgi:sarcosine oxidase subunit alpha